MSLKLISLLLTTLFTTSWSSPPTAIYLENLLALATQFGDNFEDKLSEIEAVRLSEDELYKAFPDIPIVLAFETWNIHQVLILAATNNIKNREIWKWYNSYYDVDLMTRRDGRTELFYYVEYEEVNVTSSSQTAVDQTFTLLNLDLHDRVFAYYLPIQRTDIKHAETLLTQHYPQIRQVFKAKLDELKIKGLKKTALEDYTAVSEEMDTLWQAVFAAVNKSVAESVQDLFRFQNKDYRI
ncbi:unnamed protein product [Bursaphelenchus xylophilus]|uniref:(pine wood nematode) hypothetical protein n=1 Tax=Bursaphelenchus xylophilus TaxID=6326 RepID=A0A1I7RTM9_BURXY|nr:unnamed protein product [Bursaphelenchus xylophilus]CAG9122296.1 unnamed protein product [Bursaphelenchus xylophilus]